VELGEDRLLVRFEDTEAQLKVADDVEVKVQRQAVAAIVPKGTVKQL